MASRASKMAYSAQGTRSGGSGRHRCRRIRRRRSGRRSACVAVVIAVSCHQAAAPISLSFSVPSTPKSLPPGFHQLVVSLSSGWKSGRLHAMAADLRGGFAGPSPGTLPRRPSERDSNRPRFMTLTLTLNFWSEHHDPDRRERLGPGRARRRRAPSSYRWIALATVTLGTLMVFINQSIVLISLPDIFRGIELNPLTPGNTGYLLWMLMGFTRGPGRAGGHAGPGRGHLRPGQDLQPRLHRLHRVLPPAGRDLAHGHAGALWLIAMRDRPGGRRGHALRQLLGHHHRRVPGRSARPGPGHQQHRGHRRLLRRARPRRRAGPRRVASRVPDLGALRHPRHPRRLREARGPRECAPRPRSTGSGTSRSPPA